MFSNWFCLKLRPGPSRRITQRVERKKGVNLLDSSSDDDVILSGLFHPLKKSTTMDCFKGGEVTNLDDIYCLRKIIGKGGFSEVWLATSRRRPKEDAVAIKLMSKSLVSSGSMVNEMSVLKVAYNCPFVVQMTSSFQTPTHYAIVMKYATGGTLNDRARMVRRFSELVARFYAAEIAEGLFGLHGRGIIHRDVNLDNILIGDNGHVLLSDFGLSLLRDSVEISESCHAWPDATKAQFPAPELLLGQEYDKTVDWWSFGIILYRMVIGEYPFSKRRIRGNYVKNYSLEMIYKKETFPTYVSQQTVTLITVLLSRRRTTRLGRGVFEENDVTNMDFFYHVDWYHLRDHTLPPPFHDLVQNATRSNKRPTSLHLPLTNMGIINAQQSSKAAG